MAFVCRCDLNRSNAEATLVLSTRIQRFLKTSIPCHVCINLESFHWTLSDEYPFARVSVILSGFLPPFVFAKSATSSIRVKTTIHSVIYSHHIGNQSFLILLYLRSLFRASRKTILVAHGFKADTRKPWMSEMKNELLKKVFYDNLMNNNNKDNNKK